jgi:mono/diheme cytochrome c family protein
MASARKKKVMTMKKLSMNLWSGAVAASVFLLGGCALEVENTQAAEELARLAQPPGSVYTGWRVFQDRCAGCHGAPATGTMAAPDLLPIVRNMGPRRFVGLVLMRYDWSLPAAQTGGSSAEREALVEGVMQRQQGALTMPEWQGEPSVNAHIMDLYAYLAARANGAQGPGRPAP